MFSSLANVSIRLGMFTKPKLMYVVAIALPILSHIIPKSI
jgi:hypothetical protein